MYGDRRSLCYVIAYATAAVIGLIMLIMEIFVW